MRALWLCLALLFGVIAPPQAADAHALEPGFLEIEPLGPDEWRLTWRKPQVGGQPMDIDAVLPGYCTPRRGPEPRFDGRAFVTGWVALCDQPLSDGVLTIDGLDRTATDVLVRFIAEPDATAQTLRVTPDDIALTLPAAPTTWGVLTSYASLGIDHILGGLDHLLFVFALLLLIRDARKLFLAITAFTLAHSITLAAASLGWFALPVRPVEAVIALSIVFLSAEILAAKSAVPRLSETYPWVVAFAFGLLHGMGFATALSEIGLPPDDIPLALVSFNIGVEIGQLLFIFAILALAILLRAAAPRVLTGALARGGAATTIAAYAIGGVAAYWTIDRLALFFA